MLRDWIRHGFLNTLEHGITRFADAAISLVLLWKLAPETFSKLALAQALVAPLLFFFVSPEAVLYRDFAKWKGQGASQLALRVHALRRFAWGKIQAALVLSLLLAYLYPGAGGFYEKLSALIWAFSLALTPQISGADREFLRIELRLKALNFLSLFQKAALLVGTLVVAWMGCRLSWLAAVAGVTALATALLARIFAVRSLKLLGATSEALRGRGGITTVEVIRESLTDFSLVSHLCGVCTNWVQTMDLFFLGVFSYPARLTGLYAAALKISNFANALPVALTNLFSVWMGRREVSDKNQAQEKTGLFKFSACLFAACAVQAAVLASVAPWAIAALSHGRWSYNECVKTAAWLRWILAGNVIVSSAYVLNAWLMVRTDIRKFFAKAILPWTLLSCVLYAFSAYRFGAMGAAQANVPVAVVYVLVLLMLRGKNQ